MPNYRRSAAPMFAALKDRFVGKLRRNLAARKGKRLGKIGRTIEQLEKRDLLAGVIMQSVVGDGATKLSLTYDVQSATPAFEIGFYRSADSLFGGDVFLDSMTINSSSDLTLGTHVKTLSIGGGTNQIALPGAGATEVSEDYYILAVANPAVTAAASSAIFEGVYHPAASDVFVHGRNTDDNLLIDSSYRVTLNGVLKKYAATDVTGFRVRGHNGNDVLNAETTTKAAFLYGGSGDDVLKGGNAADTLEGADGDDLLGGGKGNDSLDGGNGSDEYWVIGTTAGTDTFKDTGTLGIDRIVAGSSSTTIVVAGTFSLANNGIETISSNGFTAVSLIGISTANVLNLTGISLSGIAMIDGLGGADIITGSSGDDFIRGGIGVDTINGGLGNDVAHFAGRLASYSIVRTGDTVKVTDLDSTVDGYDGIDTLVNVELLRFLDADFSLLPSVNAAPVAVADNVSIDEDAGSITISVLANDSDPDTGDSIKVVAVDSTGLAGTVSITPGGTGVIYTYGNLFQQLKPGETATQLFAYTIADAGGKQATATVTVAVTGVNDLPVANPDAATIAEDGGVIVVAVLANDTDPDVNDTKRVVSVSSVGVAGVVQVATGGNGVLFYTNNSYNQLPVGGSAVETIIYTMADAAGATSTSTLIMTVTGANDAPVAVGDTATLSEDSGPTTLAVLTNDTDADLGDTKTVISVNGAGYPGGWELVCIYGVCAPLAYPGLPAVLGTLTVAADGQGVVYSPGNALQYLKAGETYSERFTYTIADAAGALSSAWVTLTITGANDAPVAAHDSLLVANNAAPMTVNVLANDSDVDLGDTKRVLSVDTTGLRGTATVSVGGASIVYSVGTAFLDLLPGQTATETFTYTIADTAGAQSSATVVVRVGGANSVPIAVADSASATENGAPVTINVLSNDTDEDAGDTKTVVSVGAVGLVGTASVAPGGTGVVYTIGNAYQSLAQGATAIESFTYTMRDSGGAQSTATVIVTVTGVNDAPVAIANTATTSEDGVPITINVLDNDSDVDQGDTKQIVSVLGTALQGSVSITPDGSSLIYSVGSAFQSLKAGAIATEVFSYTMRDSVGAQSTANVTVTITGVNDSPVAVANAFTLTEDATAATLAVLTNDTDPDVGDTKRVVSINTAGILGTASIATNGTGLVYSAGNAFQHLIAGQIATETFTYTMADALGAQSTASVAITITGVTDGPVAVNDVAAAHEDGGPIVINVLANDTNDLNPGDTLTITSIDGAGRFASITLILIYGVGVGQFNPGFQRMLGQASIAADGRSIIYSPMQSLNAGEVGTDMFKYTITGTGGGVSTGIVTVTVTGANDAPIAGNDRINVASDASATTINVLANDIDADTRIDPPPPVADELGPWDVTPVDTPDTKTVIAVDTTGLQGSVAIASGGASVVYSVGGTLLNLPFGATATETFTYTMRDSAGAQSTATVTVTVAGVNHAPVARADSASAVENGAPITIDVLANDTDADIAAGDSLTIQSVNGTGLQGTVQIVSSRIVYTVGNAFQTLRAGVTATEIFNYTAVDRGGALSSTQVTVTVTGANDAPVAVANTLSLSEDAAPTTIAVLTNDTDIDSGDTKTVLSVNGVGMQSSVAVAPGGTGVIFTVGSSLQDLNNGQTAIETFSYTMVDSAGAQSTATVTVTIIGANEPVVYVSPPTPSAGAIVGTADDDILSGTAAADVIFGQAGDDEIDGGLGDDTIFGGLGRDTLVGGAGNDILSGGEDADDLTGGAGADIFKYYLVTESTTLRADKIKDFSAAHGDKIDLSLIDANYLIGGNNSFVVSSAFTGVAGQLTITTTASGVYWVKGDVNGDGVADIEIEVRSSAALTVADFIL